MHSFYIKYFVKKFIYQDYSKFTGGLYKGGLDSVEYDIYFYLIYSFKLAN